MSGDSIFGVINFFVIFRFIFGIAFLAILGVIVFVIIRNISTWHSNNNSPVLTVDAKIVAKRTNTHYSNTGNDMMTHSHTTCYVTFEFESTDRLELSVPSDRYGYMVEGDSGKLTFQGTRFLKFERV